MMRHFSIKELCRTASGIPNIPNDEQKKSLENLVINVLDPLRELYGKPITVNSGFRNDAVNRSVGGVPFSQHTKGEAADISAGGKYENKKLFELAKTLNFDQLIDEKDFTWIHISYRDRKNRKQILHLD